MPLFSYLSILLFSLFLVACTKEPTDHASSAKTSTAKSEPRDLSDIYKSGVIRVLSPDWDQLDYLPREGTPANRYRAMITEFAIKHDLTIEWIYVDRFAQLSEKLLSGEGDLVVANMTVTKERSQQLLFTVPVEHIEEWLVVRPDPELKEVHDLALANIVVPQGSAFKVTLDKVAKPGWNVVEKAKNASPQALVDDVLSGRYTATVVDSNVGEWLLTGLDLSVLGSLGNPRDIAWAVHPESPNLLSALNQFLHEYQLAEVQSDYTGDWSEIVERRTLRMITRNSSDSYFMWRGELMGYEYDLIKKFADRHDLYLDVIVADGQDMIDLLLQGKGDLIASSQARLASRRARGVEFTRPYNVVDEVLIGRSGLELTSLEELSGFTVMVEANSSYREGLLALKQQGIDFQLVSPDDLEINDEADLMGLVTDGIVDFTVVDNHLAARELLDRPDLQVYLSVTADVGHGWAVRKDNKELLAKLNQYIKKHYRGLFFNVTWQKYFDTERGKFLGRDPLEISGQLSPYDSIVRPLAKDKRFDWRMIVSQMYQESRFNPKARSHVGAKGLMQVLPRTGKELGIHDLYNPEANIRAGVFYLDWVRDRFPKQLVPAERVLFALAGYNAGYGHVQDARRLARKKGWNPDQWFGSVEKAMLLLSKRKYYRNARFGYVRGREPVEYVRQIQRRYQGYQSIAR
ncbi:transporter substrate-binding domain-containing protein [Litoribrevibacter euphylliae]|uniref:Transporter substrate-binding domain-containing protein n=1 Tax=Litoribrevibacter euphylliae TaxID=1834034 RepID=A0ABV7HE82_9GAMM